MEIKDGSKLLVVNLLHRENKGKLSQLRGAPRVWPLRSNFKDIRGSFPAEQMDL